MDNKTISNILNQRKELVQLISVAVLLAFGVSLLASILPNVLSINDVQSLLLGVILILVGIGYLIVLITRSRTGRVLVHANVLFDPKSESTIAPFKYKFMFDLSQALAAVFQENTALKNTWHSHPLTTWHQPSEETKIPSSEGETSAPSPEGE